MAGHSNAISSVSFSLPLAYAEWAGNAQNRVDWHKRVTKPPFTIGKPFLRRPRGDSRRTAEQKREVEHRGTTRGRDSGTTGSL